MIRTYFPNLKEDTAEQLGQLAPLYEDWNAKINVISRKDMDSFYERHVLHALAIEKMQLIKKGARILDVGTGGGFPGIPLAILHSEASFHLVDSITKKIKVVQAVAQELNLENVKAEKARVEQLRGSYDLILSRAVAKTTTLLDWTSHLLAKNGQHLLLKGGELTEELAEAKKHHKGIKIKVYPLSDWFKEEFFETKKLVHIRKT